MSSTKIEEKLAFVLMDRILLILQESGASVDEALIALRAAETLLPELNLKRKPTTVIQT